MSALEPDVAHIEGITVVVQKFPIPPRGDSGAVPRYFSPSYDLFAPYRLRAFGGTGWHTTCSHTRWESGVRERGREGGQQGNINHFVPFEVRLTHGTEACPPHARRQACTIRVRACPDLSHCARVP